MARFTTIEICKEFMHFSAAHFTIFSQTERERLHGHNFRVAVRVVAPVDDNGLCFNYKIIKDHIRDLCIELDEYTLLPGNSPYLNIIREDAHYRVEFDGEYMLFLAPEVKILPLSNITVEELSHHLLHRVLEDGTLENDYAIQEIEIKVASGSNQWGTSSWTKS